jgi:hypothetical protein
MSPASASEDHGGSGHSAPGWGSLLLIEASLGVRTG